MPMYQTICRAKTEKTSLTEHHRRNIADLQAENSRLDERHEQAISKLQAENDSLKGRLFKTLKIGMVKVGGSLTDKFNAAKAAGFR